MITIHAKSKRVANSHMHDPQVYSKAFGYNITPGYIRGWCKPNFPVPALIHTVGYAPENEYTPGRCDYMYVHDDFHIWTFWKGGKLVEEWLKRCACGEQYIRRNIQYFEGS